VEIVCLYVIELHYATLHRDKEHYVRRANCLLWRLKWCFVGCWCRFWWLHTEWMSEWSNVRWSRRLPHLQLCSWLCRRWLRHSCL